jgi:LysM repeat protein
VKSLLILALLASTALAQTSDTQTYRAKQGDTLGLIAAEYYGDRGKAGFLVIENKIDTKKPVVLKPGQKLRVPISRTIVTDVGDSYDKLAKEFLGEERRGEYLAAMNNRTADDGLPAGVELVIPFSLTYVITAPTTYDGLAQQFLGDSKHGELLRGYNNSAKSELEAGDSVVIPVFTAKLQPGKAINPDAAAIERTQRRTQTIAQAGTRLPEARYAWESAEYRRVIALLGDIDTAYLDPETAVAVLVQLGSAYIAYDTDEDRAAARTAFKAALARRPNHKLSTFEYSEKIRAVWDTLAKQ